VVPLAHQGGEEYGTEKLFHKEVPMRKIARECIGMLTAAALTLWQATPLFAALKVGDEYAESAAQQSEVARSASPHDELRGISAPVATFCYEYAAEPVLYAIAYNQKARIVEALRVMKEAGGCYALTELPELSDDAILWTGKVIDDGEEVSLVMYQALAVVLVNVETLSFEQGVLMCWYTDEDFRCF
jgi:hypothetical protein